MFWLICVVPTFKAFLWSKGLYPRYSLQVGLSVAFILFLHLLCSPGGRTGHFLAGSQRGACDGGGKWGTARTLTSCIYWSCLPQLTDESSIIEALFLLTFRFLDLSSTLNLIPVFLIKKMEKFRVEVWVAFPAPVTLTGFSNQCLCVIGSELSLLCLYTVYFCSS